MSRERLALPSFTNPPVSEVVLSVQFEPLDGFQLHHFGLLWETYRTKFPNVETHPPLEPVFETFEQRFAGPLLRFGGSYPLPRMWMVNEATTELIQVQRDRFTHNWRKLADHHGYPRYVALRREFEQELRAFEAWCSESSLSPLRANQCEISYINQVDPPNRNDQHAAPHRIFKLLSPSSLAVAGASLESVNAAARYLITEQQASPLGRLHIEWIPALAGSDSRPVFMLNLTARGAPIRDGLEGVFEFLDLGHRVIVEAFKEVSTEEMHKVWELE